MTALPLWSQQ